jgi:hypothetical protein
MAWY